MFRDRAPFFERLDAFLGALPERFRYAVELRNRDWIDGELCELLRGHRAALVLVDLAGMPHPAELAGRLDLVTTDFVYARLIGDRKRIDALTRTFDRIVVDQSRRLSSWAALLRGLGERAADVWVFANNHYAGHGPATIEELRHLVEGGEPGGSAS